MKPGNFISARGIGLALLLSILSANTFANGPVLLELFTSEGCSSCPPADAALARFQETGEVDGTPVITLGFHVDYWNNLGWKDRWSSANATQRQTQYNLHLKNPSNYTPQLIADGTSHEVGSKGTEVREMIKTASAAPKIPMKAAVVSNKSTSTLQVQLQLGGVPPALSDSKSVVLAAAMVNDNVQSDVKRGENAGRILKHSSVVTGLVSLQNVNVSEIGTGSNIPVSLKHELQTPPTRVVFFLQDPATLKILGACQVENPES